MSISTLQMETRPDPFFVIKTKANRELYVYSSCVHTANELSEVTERLQSLHNPADERRPADISYNCHGFTFIGKMGWFATGVPVARLAIIGRAIETVIEREALSRLSPEQEIQALLTDNGFEMIAYTTDIDVKPLMWDIVPEIGDIVLYKTKRVDGSYSIDHSGIIAKFCSEPYVLSKFSFGGEYFHPIKRVLEEYGRIVEVYTDRELE